MALLSQRWMAVATGIRPAAAAVAAAAGAASSVSASTTAHAFATAAAPASRRAAAAAFAQHTAQFATTSSSNSGSRSHGSGEREQHDEAMAELGDALKRYSQFSEYLRKPIVSLSENNSSNNDSNDVEEDGLNVAGALAEYGRFVQRRRTSWSSIWEASSASSPLLATKTNAASSSTSARMMHTCSSSSSSSSTSAVMRATNVFHHGSSSHLPIGHTTQQQKSLFHSSANNQSVTVFLGIGAAGAAVLGLSKAVGVWEEVCKVYALTHSFLLYICSHVETYTHALSFPSLLCRNKRKRRPNGKRREARMQREAMQKVAVGE